VQCNIDARGKALRLIAGMIVTLAAVVMLALLAMKVLQGGWFWGIGIAALLLGALQIFEGRSGWCVLRAMGFKTPI